MIRTIARAVARAPYPSATRRWCSAGSTEEDWVVLGHVDRPMPFEPSVHAGEDVVRAETELYRLYRQVEEGEQGWIEFIELFATCDQELTATAFMWTMYLKVIPTLFGVKREFSRMLHYHHEYDVRVLNVMVMRLLQSHSGHEAVRFFYKFILESNKKIAAPTTQSLNIALEAGHVHSPLEDEWWLDRGILFVEAKQIQKPNIIRRKLDQSKALDVTAKVQLDLVARTINYAFDRHKVKPDFTTLYLLARLCPVDIDLGRHYASALCMYMETLKDSEVPLEARLIVSEFLHWKMENIEVNPVLSLMQGPALKTSEKMLILLDDCVQAVMHPFRKDDIPVLEGKRVGNVVHLELGEETSPKQKGQKNI